MGSLDARPDLPVGQVLVLSAKYGLLGLDDEIENYDLRMGDEGSVNGSTLRQQVTMNGDGDARVIVLGSAPYVELVREAWPDAEALLSGGIGVQLKQLADIYKGEPEIEEPASVEEAEPEPAPAGRPVPQNWLDMCEEANTESARKWWKNYCERYARGEV
jgi:hypothetical protein